MKWPGMTDPTKRKPIIKFLLLTGGIAIAAATVSTIVQSQLSQNDPLKQCIDQQPTGYEVSATLEVFINGEKQEIPANVGFEEECQRALYTLSDNGRIYAEWEEPYDFEIGHFLWMWDFPIKEMDASKSKIIVNGEESPHFIHAPLEDGNHYRAEFRSKGYDESKDQDFMPPEE